MRTNTLLPPTALILSGLLVLAGVLSDARPALAQMQEACPLPPGVTPPPDPPVTAQQVVDGSATLADFTRGARDAIKEQSESASLEQAAYLLCVSKEDNGISRSGNLYIVVLTPDGRVLAHTKSASLTGRLLNPLIYGTILSALGVSPTDLANSASPDPATAAQGVAAVIRTLTQEPDGAFDATTPVEGVRPGIPGASGHAAVYVSLAFRAPLLILAGFDIGESHLVPVSAEDIDYGDPSVTARDVVDRETLKAFVAEAWDYISGNEGSQSASVSAKQLLALRAPNGPWRHGSVYLYVLDRISNIILVHGAFPDRFEGRPLVPTVRDAVTGKFILSQVLAAAASNPGGGFVEYYFDDPTDDTDSADIPKVGYAREFTGELRLPGGRVVPTHYVIGSGFYQSPGGAGTLEGRLENPGSPHAFQSGIGALWGWVCEAEMVEIEIATAQGDFEWHMAEYGMERSDTQDICGDTDNGFVLLFNWNQLGEGEHMVTALVDGAELGRARVTVTTLGEGEQQEFLRDAMGECVAEDFPAMGEAVTLEWQQNSQNFVITNVE